MTPHVVHGLRVDSTGQSIGIVGSRSFAFELCPARALETVGQALVEADWPVSKIVSGGAEGADAAARAFADYFEIPYTECEPNFDQFDEAWQAFHARNSEIVRASDRLLALWDGDSTGTLDTIAKARGHLGDPAVHIHGIGDGTIPPLSDLPVRDL
ncbi:hypothetical protein SAMN05216388_10555 [Halorientalis persicus]|uniref:DUF2493 domain-containing protein n=1 Tax=Halorientalis persicus TaxID=1367881 RepID=A0A1H8WCG2_9EURY|nr:hypothetical protein [Halorientalis persicus]SEP25344.1 hypothetical protein SAMN05216388_10555 [Halorientalis persicus]